MPKGYSLDFAHEVMAREANTPIVRLAHACIKHRIPVTHVAERLGVSRYCVYMWFTGKSNPRSNKDNSIMDMLREIEAQ